MSEIEFGDLEVGDRHLEIEEWEQADEALSAQGLSFDDRRELWRSLDPDTEVLDWYEDLLAFGMTPVQAQDFIRVVGAS